MNLNEYKNRIIRLVEERGVAASRETSTVNSILWYIQKKISLNGEIYGLTTKFYVPSRFLDGFSFLHNPTILVTNKDITEHYVMLKDGSGNCTIDSNNSVVVNGKLNNVVIKIRSYSVMNELIDRTFLNTIYHELNHLYDVFKNYEKDKNVVRYCNDVKRISSPNRIEDEKFQIYWKEVFYRLFSNTEFNALIASVYGDLQGMKSVRKNFHNDYKKTLAYKAYSFFLKNLDIGLYAMGDNDVLKIIEQMNKNGLSYIFHHKSSDLDKTKMYIENFIKKRCKRLLDGIGSVASLYYDKVENDGDKIIHCDYGDEIYTKKLFK